MKIRIIISILLTLALAACGGGGGSSEDDGGGGDVIHVDLFSDGSGDKDGGVRTDLEDEGYVLPDSKPHDVPPTDTPGTETPGTDATIQPDTPEIDVPAGAVGSECTGPIDCSSGICLMAGASSRCSGPCDLENPCPFNWFCGSLPGQMESICIPTHVTLCRPCSTNQDCYSNGVDVGDRCISLGGKGAFCGGGCMGGLTCPTGYDCHGVVDLSGQPSDQCIKSGGECECSQQYTNEGAWTYCFNQNLYGKCEGERFCSAGGLTPCSAKVPSEEICNGSDDDCDGEIDEGAPDTDNDGSPDCMDDDDDGDNIADFSDNCPLVSNPGQEDLDQDNIGDACETDTDGDGDPNTSDCAPLDDTIFHGNEELCDGIDNDCIGGVPLNEQDNDGDGFRGCEGDCNDSNPSVHPDAAETCETNYDDNCDDNPNTPDPIACSTFYRDDDGDGWGTEESKCLCVPEAPFTASTMGDCDDTSNLIHPDATEDCDTASDDNCDGQTNEQNGKNCETFYKDGDSDGFGVPESICACGPLNLYTADNIQDCDDSNPDVNPNGVEDCLTAMDDNCNGTNNDLNALNCNNFYSDADNDDYGTGLPVCLCVPEAVYGAANPDDCDDTDPAVYPGAQEKCSTDYDDNCNGDTDEVDALGCTVYWVDKDNDTFAGTEECHCEAPPNAADYPEDCCDQDPDAFPDQPLFFAQQNSCGNFDYNCDGEDSREEEDSCVQAPCNGVGWFQSQPSCGQTANWCMNCSECGVCIGAIVQQTQKCH